MINSKLTENVTGDPAYKGALWEEDNSKSSAFWLAPSAWSEEKSWTCENVHDVSTQQLQLAPSFPPEKGSFTAPVTTGLAVGGFLCLSLAGMYVVRSSCFPIADSPGMDCGCDYLCGNVDVRFKWGVSFSFLVPFQESRLSGFELVFCVFGHGKTISLCICCLFSWLLRLCRLSLLGSGQVWYGLLDSGGVHWCSSCGWVRCLVVCFKHVIGCFIEINAFCAGYRCCFVHELVQAFYLSLGLRMLFAWFFCVWTPFLLQILWSLLSLTLVHCLTGLLWGFREWQRVSLTSTVLTWWLSSEQTQPQCVLYAWEWSTEFDFNNFPRSLWQCHYFGWFCMLYVCSYLAVKAAVAQDGVSARVHTGKPLLSA